MSKLIKFVFISVSVLIVLLLTISVLVAVLVDVNQYKEEISQLVADETGLTMEINGDLSLSILSGVKFKANNIKLSHDKALIADIESLNLWVAIHSIYAGTPKITQVELHANTLNISRDKTGNYNFLPLLDNSNEQINNPDKNIANGNDNNSESELLSLNQLSINDIELSIDHLQYLDDINALSIKLEKVNSSLSFLPIIDHHELIIDDPRLLVAYSYSGKLEVKQALINQYQLADVTLDFKDQMGDFFAEELSFSLIEEGIAHALPPLVFKANGNLALKLTYRTPEGAVEPLWTQPETIKAGKLDFTFSTVKLSGEQYQIDMEQAHLILEDLAIIEAGKYALSDLFINSLVMESRKVDLNLKNTGEYQAKQLFLQVNELPVTSRGKPLKPLSEEFLKKFSQKGKIKFSTASVSNKAQALNNINVLLQGKDQTINLSNLSFNLMESELHSEGQLIMKKKNPHWEVKMHSDKLNLQSVSDLLNQDFLVNGHITINNHLSGILQGSDFQLSSGKVHTSGKNLTANGLDIDKILNDFESSQSVGLLDVGAYTLLGPAGVFVSKGKDYHNLSKSIDKKGTSVVVHLNSDISIANDIATMDDVAMSTKKHRLAVQGKINMLDQTFMQFEVATVDKYGCPINKERVTGNINSPSVEKASVLLSGVVNPVSSVVSQVGKRLKIQCDSPFYTGVVKSPVN